MSSEPLREIFAEFGIEWDTKALDAGSRTVAGAISHVRELGTMLAASEIVQGIRDFAADFEDAAGRLQDTADVMGVTTTELQELKHAAVMAGLSTDAASAALSHLQQASAAAGQGAKGPSDAFRALGVHVRDAGGEVRPVSDLLDDLAVNFSHVQDPARRAQLAQDLFGRSGARLVNVLHDGEGGLAALRGELEQLGGGMFPEAVAAANDYGDATDRLRVAQSSLRSVVAVELLPVLTWLATEATDLVSGLSRLTRGTNVARVAMVLLGAGGAVTAGRMLAAWGPAIARFGVAAAALVLVALAIDDIITLAQGGDSALGAFVDRSYGLGTSARLARELNDAWEGMGEALAVVQEAVAWTFETYLPGRLTAAREMVTSIFEGAYGWVADSFGLTWDGIEQRVRRFFGWVSDTLGSTARELGLDRVADTLRSAAMRSTTVQAAVAVNGTRERTIGDVADEWYDVLHGAREAQMRGAVHSEIRAPGQPRAPAPNRNVTAHITVNGAGDPAAVADHVVQRMRTAEADGRDGNHPLERE